MWNARNGSVPVGVTEMHYAAFGTGKKILIALPGLSDGLRTVKGMAQVLALPYRHYLKDWTVYMFSRKNDMPDGYTIRQMADDQAEVLEKLGISHCSVLGVSQGGMIAQYLAADHPEAVEQLVLAVTAPYTNDMVRENVERWLTITEKNDHKALMIDTAEHYYTEPYLRKYRMMYPVLGMIGKPETYDRFRINAQAILSFDARNDLSGITCPVYIIAGRQDRIVGVKASEVLHEMIPQSECYIYDHCGHAPNEEDKQFYDRIFTWLNRKKESV